MSKYTKSKKNILAFIGTLLIIFGGICFRNWSEASSKEGDDHNRNTHKIINVNNDNSQGKDICQQYTESECLQYQDTCSLCPERISSSFVSCHTIEFCENIPFE